MRASKHILLLVILAAALLLTGCSQPVAEPSSSYEGAQQGAIGLMTTTAMAPDSQNAVEGYVAAAENKSYRLYVSPESLDIILEDKQSGLRLHGTQQDPDNKSNKTWRGLMESGFALEYYRGTSPMPARVDAFNGSPAITLSYIDAGFDAHITYEELGIAMVLQVRLTDDGFLVNVPGESLVESEENRLCALYLYPFFGSTKLGEKPGYMLVPEGSGALISLVNNNGKYKTPYTKRIYGDNLGTRKESTSLFGKWPPKEPVKVLASYFGMAYTQEGIGFLATVEKGQYNAELLAYPNGAITEYDWITTKFIYREQYNMLTTRTKGILTVEKNPYLRDVQVHYSMLVDSDVGYVKMAETYRGWLLEKELIEKKDVSYKTRVDFLGGDSKDGLVAQSVVPVTTIAKMEEVLDDLAVEGLTDVLAIYRGWQKGGLTANYGSGNLNLEGKLGSEKELLQVADKVAGMGGAFLLQQNFLYANPNRLYNTNMDIAKGINQTIMFTNTNSYPVESLYFLSGRRIQELAESFNSLYGGHENLGVAAGGITNTLYSYVAEGMIHSRGSTAAGMNRALSTLSSNKVALEQPFDYLWGSMDYLLGIPLYTSNYNFFSMEVPFLPLALNGLVPYYADYVNFEPNNQEFFLKMIEFGAYPSFIITWESPVELEDTNSSDIYSSQYTVYRDLIIEYSNALRDMYSQVEGVGMKSHAEIADEVFQVEYNNGVKVLINYRETPYTYQGNRVGPMDYLLYR